MLLKKHSKKEYKEYIADKDAVYDEVIEIYGFCKEVI